MVNFDPDSGRVVAEMHARIREARQLVGDQLRRRQDVAQVVIDLGDGETERRQPPLLLQHRGKIALHGVKLVLRHADLVVAAARPDPARGILRVVAKRHHVGGDAPHRPHQEVVQREEQQHRGDDADQERYKEDVAGEAQHGCAQRRLIEDDFDEVTPHRGRTKHPHDVVGRSPE